MRKPIKEIDIPVGIITITKKDNDKSIDIDYPLYHKNKSFYYYDKYSNSFFLINKAKIGTAFLTYMARYYSYGTSNMPMLNGINNFIEITFSYNFEKKVTIEKRNEIADIKLHFEDSTSCFTSVEDKIKNAIEIIRDGISHALLYKETSKNNKKYAVGKLFFESNSALGCKTITNEVYDFYRLNNKYYYIDYQYDEHMYSSQIKSVSSSLFHIGLKNYKVALLSSCPCISLIPGDDEKKILNYEVEILCSNMYKDKYRRPNIGILIRSAAIELCYIDNAESYLNIDK